MTKAEYVKKLEKMLKKHKHNACEYCPATWVFNPIIYFVPKETCAICQRFVNIDGPYEKANCPCNVLGSTQAVSRAEEAIKRYKQEHSEAEAQHKKKKKLL